MVPRQQERFRGTVPPWACPCRVSLVRTWERLPRDAFPRSKLPRRRHACLFSAVRWDVRLLPVDPLGVPRRCASPQFDGIDWARGNSVKGRSLISFGRPARGEASGLPLRANDQGRFFFDFLARLAFLPFLAPSPFLSFVSGGAGGGSGTRILESCSLKSFQSVA